MSSRKRETKIKETNTDTSSKKINTVLTKRVRLKCKNLKQKEYANLITDREITFCVGPAGSGKSYVAVSRAIELLQNKTNKYNKLILCKPYVEAGEKLGFLPGDIKEKMEPILSSLIDIIDKIIGETNRKRLEDLGVITIQPLGFIRGKTIDNSILIVDEAQNMKPSQIKTTLTRIGENSKFVISGDMDQSDLFRDFTKTGLFDAWNRHKNIEELGFCKFDNRDIVRNPIISKILKNYSDENNNNEKNLLLD